MTQASDIITRASTLLFDPANIKWSVAELLTWITDGQRALAALVPEATSVVTVMKLVAGARQTLPAGAWTLLEATRNMGTDGVTPGRTLKREDRAVLDETNPSWYSQGALTSPNIYMYNARDRRAFYVSPPSDGNGYIEVNYSAQPSIITDPSDTLTIDDIYVPALVDYVMFRASSKKFPFAGEPQEASAYLASFAMYVGKDATVLAQLAAQMGNLGIAPPQGQGSGGAQ